MAEPVRIRERCFAELEPVPAREGTRTVLRVLGEQQLLSQACRGAGVTQPVPAPRTRGAGEAWLVVWPAASPGWSLLRVCAHGSGCQDRALLNISSTPPWLCFAISFNLKLVDCQLSLCKCARSAT